MASASAFSTTDDAIIHHQVELDPTAQSVTAAASGRSIYEVYDILSTARKIVEQRFQRVALQFPDEALIDSVPVFWSLKREIKKLYSSEQLTISTPKLYILADTSYGSCCVDEVAAQHVDADVVVHYGHACLSPTARLPAIYVFAKQPIDVEAAATKLVDSAEQEFFNRTTSSPKALVLTYEVSWNHAAEQVYEQIQKNFLQRGITVPFVMTTIDTFRNYQDKIAQQQQQQQQQKAKDSFTTQISNGSSSCDSTSCCTTTTCPPSPTCCQGSGSCSSIVDETTTSATPAAALTTATTPTPTPTTTTSSSTSCLLGPSRSLPSLPFSLSPSECHYLYLGPESLSLTNLLLTLGPTVPFLSYNPLTNLTRLETGSTNRLLMRRYAQVLKAKDASVIGLLVGTLAIHSYLPLLKHLRTLLTSSPSSRKVYTISVGKLNPAKLGNFQEIDCFILIACPENSLIDTKQFHKPIVTPFEIQLALQSKGEGVLVDLNLGYPLDLISVLQRSHQQQEEEEEEGEEKEQDQDQPQFSLISGGKYIQRRKFDLHKSSPKQQQQQPEAKKEEEKEKRIIQSESTMITTNSNTVGLKNQDGTITQILQSASLIHLENRTWKGLDQSVLDQPSDLEEGRVGIAKGYLSPNGIGEGN